MTRWSANVIAFLLANFSGVANARTDCEAIPRGPERTDCYLALSQFYRAQSDLAAATARAQSDAACGIGQLPEQTLQNGNCIIADRRSLFRGRPIFGPALL
jgi:hypothetical protein